MTRAVQTYEKTARETKAACVDCSPVLAIGETIATVGTPVQECEPVDGEVLVITGLAPSAQPLTHPNFTAIAAGRAIVFLVSGGTPKVCYKLTIPYTTSAGQDLDAEIELEVR